MKVLSWCSTQLKERYRIKEVANDKIHSVGCDERCEGRRFQVQLPSERFCCPCCALCIALQLQHAPKFLDKVIELLHSGTGPGTELR